MKKYRFKKKMVKKNIMFLPEKCDILNGVRDII